MSSGKRLFVWNLPYDCAENDVSTAASSYGSVRHVYFPEVKPGTKKSGAFNNGYGFIEFATAEVAKKFLEAAEKGMVTLGDGDHMRAVKAAVAKASKRKRKIKTDESGSPKKEATDDVTGPFNWNVDAASEAVSKSPADKPVPMETVAAASKEETEPHLEQDALAGEKLLQKLPAELWSRLLSYIDLPSLIRLKRVCRQMYRIVETTIANMRTLDLTKAPSVLFDRPDNCPIFGRFSHTDNFVISKIFCESNHWHGLRQLKLNSDNVRISPISVKTIAKSLSSLEELSLCCHRNVNAHLRRLVMNNRNLRRFILVLRSGSISIKTIRCIVKCCRNLTHLTLESKNPIEVGDLQINSNDVNSVQALVASSFSKKSDQLRFLNLKLTAEQSKPFEILTCCTFPTLVVAHLANFPAVPLAALRQLVLPRLPVDLDGNVLQHLPCLESLIVMAPPNSRDQVRPSGADLTFLASPHSRIVEIALVACNLREADLIFLQRMQCIDLRDNCGLTDDNIKALIASNPNIVRLGLRGLCQITGALLRFIASSCPRMKVLNVADCPAINNDALQSMMTARSSASIPASVSTGIVVVAPGCHIEADQSLLNLLHNGGVSLMCNWGDIAKAPVVAFRERNFLEGEPVEWPLGTRQCPAHRINLEIIFDPLVDIDEADFSDAESFGDDEIDNDDWDDDFS